MINNAMMNLAQWLDYQQQLHHKEIDLGLERISCVYQKLFPNGLDFKVITIAGTNGKGSTGNFLATICQNAAISYGWFSSPHIEKYNERIVVNNTQATDDEIIQAFEKIEKIRGDISLSYFECSTLCGLIIFANKHIDLAILEVGLGGRLDSVNVVPNDASIITSIGLDHMDFLGETIEKIAFEKAGIINQNSVVFTPPNLPKVIREVAKEKNAKYIEVTKYQKPLKMLGEWQQYNANLASLAIQYLFNTTEINIDNALQHTTFTARAEKIQYNNLTLIFDTAHNPQAVQNLASIIPAGSIAIFAALKDKDINAMINSITHNIDMWYLLQLDDSRSLSVKELQKKFTHLQSVIMGDIQTTLDTLQSKHNQTIVIFGSFLTIALVKNALNNL